MSLDSSKVTLYGLLGPTNDRLVATKVTMYAVVRPTSDPGAAPRRRRTGGGVRITYTADS